MDSMDKIKAKGKVNAEGYINVADELGLSGTRGTFVPPLLLLFVLTTTT